MSRIWDVPCTDLDTPGLLAEHRELHGVWVVITRGTRGYANHPETARWRGHLRALYSRHEEQVREMKRRGWRAGTVHATPLDPMLIPPEDGGDKPAMLLSLEEQRALLSEKFARRKQPSRARQSVGRARASR
jgi:hypothetical protein